MIIKVVLLLWLVPITALAQQTDLSKTPLAGHLKRVSVVAYSRDGRQIISGGDDQTIKLWDASSGRLLKTLTGHNDYINTLSFSPDGRLIVSGSEDNTLKIWEVSTGLLLKTLTGHSGGIKAIVLSPDGQQIMSGGGDYTLKIWETNSGRQLQTLKGHAGLHDELRFSPDRMQQLVSSSYTNTIGLREVNSDKLLKTLTGHTKEVNRFCFSPDGRQVVSGSNDNTLKIWEVSSGKLLRTLSGHSDWVLAVSFSPDGKQLVSGSLDKTLKIWESSSGKLLNTLSGHSDWVNDVCFSPDGQRVVSGSSDNTLKIWSVNNGKLLRTLAGHTGEVNKVSFSPDGRQLALGNSNKTLQLWDASNGKPLRTLIGHKDRVLAVGFNFNGRQIVSGSSDKTLRIWDVSSGKLLQNFTAQSHHIYDVGVSPDGEQIVLNVGDNTIKIWGAHNGKLLQTLAGHNRGVMAIGFSLDGGQIVSSGGDKTLKLWDISSGKMLTTISTEKYPVKLEFIPQSSYLFASTEANTIEVRDAQTLELIKTYENIGFYTDADFKAPLTPDGQYEIYPYYRSFFVKKAQHATPSITLQPPVVRWETPGNSQSNVSQAMFTVKACIEGEQVTQYQLYLNKQAIGSRTIKTVSSGCERAIEEIATLKAGQNELYITATNAGGTTRSESRLLTYQPLTATSFMSTTQAMSVTTIQKRLALVIGNARYEHVARLPNPVNDAEIVREVLKECGFEVIYKTNLDKRGMVAAFQEFGEKLRNYNVGFAYYAGHGLSSKGVNYLLPVDANPQSEDEVEFEGLSTARLIRKMEETNRLTNILLFDACRNNPFARSWGRTFDEQGGFALLPPPKGTLVAYAASDGEKAADGPKQSNSPFAASFVKYVRQGGLSLMQILQRVRREVETATNERQTTQEISQLRDDFYFK